MDEDRLNMSIRKFLKEVGVTSQREIEAAVRNAKSNKGPVRITARIVSEELGLDHLVEGTLNLG